MGKSKQLEEYALDERHGRCAVCHWRKYRPGRRLELHHIQGRRGKDPHDHRNLIMLCNECHYGFHSGGKKTLDICQIATAKEEEDGEVDISYLASLRHKRALPCDPQPLPSWAIKEREDNDHQ
jgi:hypothetical protein